MQRVFTPMQRVFTPMQPVSHQLAKILDHQIGPGFRQL
jgi:hypothetical protein